MRWFAVVDDLGQVAEDARGGRLGAVDDLHLVADNALDRPAQDRVMGASEDERVDAGVDKGLQVDLRHFSRDVRVRPPLFGERDKQRRRCFDHFDIRIQRVNRFGIGPRLYGSFGGDPELERLIADDKAHGRTPDVRARLGLFSYHEAQPTTDSNGDSHAKS